MIRVALVDDQSLVREGLRRLLELTEDILVVGEACDGIEGERMLRETRPHVGLVDVRMPRRSGLGLLEMLGRDGPPVLLLTTFDEPSVAFEGLRLGARGFLLKDVTFLELQDAIRTVASGGTMFPEELGAPQARERVAQGLAKVKPGFESSTCPESLTPREHDVLRGLAQGLSNKEIAQRLGTADGTVKNHASNILAKLGVRDRTRAVLRALELGLL
jgi:DNA-binding NarL/FixJ family response regulator